MRRAGSRTVTLIVATVAAVDLGARQVPVTGTAIVAGRVVDYVSGTAPIRRARVTLNCADTRAPQTVIGDDGGGFEFGNVPAGLCVLAADKAAMVRAEFGSAKPGRPGAPLQIANGQQIRDVVLRMARGAVISGLLRDTTGQPASGVPISVMRRQYQRGAWTLQPVPLLRGGETLITDEDGVFRAYGLPPGEYLVAANLERFAPESPARVIVDADIQRALQLFSGAGGAAPARTLAPPTPGPSMRYAPVFYPGTASRGDATPVTVGIAEERTGVDFSLRLVPTVKVEGTVAGVPSDVTAGRLTLLLGFHEAASERARNFPVQPDGRFTASNVAPGRYHVDVQARPARAESTALPGFSAATEIDVQGQDITGVVLNLMPTGRLRGQFVFESASGTTPPARVSVAVIPSPYRPSFRIDMSAVPTEPIIVERIPAGQYLLVPAILDAAGKPDTRWSALSITVNGQDVTDRPFDVASTAEPMPFVVRVTDRPPELTGRVMNATGQPVPSLFIVAFSADASHWTWQSRRVDAVRAASDGSFRLPGLPAGPYLLAAVADLDQDEWFDPEVLQALRPGAIAVSLRDGQRTVQNIQIK